MSRKWSRGSQNRFWGDEDFKSFNYIKVMNGQESSPNSYGWMYDNRNPMPEWISIFDTMFDLRNKTYTFYKMKPGEVMPVHKDHYKKYMELTGAKYEDVRRVLVMLENWKPGHYLEVNGTGVVNWVAGDWFMWESDCPHSAANIGTEDRYTLQITGEVPQSSFSDWARLHDFNMPGQRHGSQNPYAKYLFTRIQDKDKPTFIYCINREISELKTLIHTKEAVKILNNKGLHFYLYEPLCSYLMTKPFRTMDFYSEIYHGNYFYLRADELNSISDYVHRNGLKNVTVHTGDYDVEKYYGDKYPMLKLVTDDIFLRVKPNFPELTNPEHRGNFTKKFICLNWRYTIHRHIVAAYLSTMSSHITWYYKADISTILNNRSWTDNKLWQKESQTQYDTFLQGLTNLNQCAPMILDCNIREATLINAPYPISAIPHVPANKHPLDPQSDLKIDSIEKFYNDIFCDIVTESRFAQPTGNYSEKTYQPMLYKKPFVLVAPPKTLQYMKEQGFKSFSDFWDESYDDCYDHQPRILKILNTIDYINSKSIAELKEMYKQMEEILEHNYNLYQEKIK